MNQETTNYIDLSPTPSSLIESLRDIGYSIETSIADIIDKALHYHAKWAGLL